MLGEIYLQREKKTVLPQQLSIVFAAFLSLNDVNLCHNNTAKIMLWRQQTLQIQRPVHGWQHQKKPMKLQNALFTIHRFQHSSVIRHYTKLY